MVWTERKETVQVSVNERRVVKRFLPHVQHQLARHAVAVVWTTAC